MVIFPANGRQELTEMAPKSSRVRLTLLVSAGLVLFGFLVSNSRPASTATEIAPGVFSRHTSYSSANQTFVVFKQYVVVFDPGEANEAPALLEEIRAQTDLPVRYVISSHHHPDHAFGVSLFEQEGAEAIASVSGKTDYEVWARKLFQHRAAKGEEGFAGLAYPQFTYIDQPLILDDGRQRMEIRHYGHGHTMADLVAWLPQHGILLSADATNNGPISLANANITHWINVLEQLEELPVQIVIPGHGLRGGPELIDMNRRFLTELMARVMDMVQRGLSFNQVLSQIEIPFYEQWSGLPVRDRPKNVQVAYLEAKEILVEKMRQEIWGVSTSE